MLKPLIFAALLLLSAPLSPAAATEKLASATSIEALTAAVNRLAVALESEQRDADRKESLEKLNLAITYLSFRSRRIETLERDITSMKKMHNNIEEAQKTWNERIAAFEERLRQSSGGEREELNKVIEDARVQSSAFKDRQARLGDEIIQLENRCYELQREIGHIEKFVEKHLDF